MNNLSDEYSIIWFQPEIDFILREKFKEKKDLYFFSELGEVVSFAKSLGSSFLLIVPNGFDEELTFEGFNGRRLANIEEESILQGFEISEPFKAYVFWTKEDFQNEIFVENDQMKWDVKEVAGEFRKEFVFWERKDRGLEKEDAFFEKSEESEEFDKEDYVKCKEFCIKSLKEIASKKGLEKLKLLYFVNLGECCSGLEEHQSALKYFSIAFDIAKENYEETHFPIAFLLISLANVYVDLREYQKTLEYDLKALNIRRIVYGETHEKTADLYFGIGELYKDLTL